MGAREVRRGGAIPISTSCHVCSGPLMYFPAHVGGAGVLFCVFCIKESIDVALLLAFCRDEETPDGARYWPRADVGCDPG